MFHRVPSKFVNYYILIAFPILVLIDHVQATTKSDSLIGGTSTKNCELKYNVAITMIMNDYACGGGIIDDVHVITAAHCVLRYGTLRAHDNVTVAIDYDDLGDDDYVGIDVDRIYVPAQFSWETTVGDVAVIRLTNPLNVTANPCLSELRLPTDRDDREGKEAVVSGQGIERIDWQLDPFEFLKFNTKHTARLRTLKTVIVSNDDCQRSYRFGFLKLMRIHDGMICAKPSNNEENEEQRGACEGDSGSPLVINDDVIVGIVSSGERFCDDAVYHGVYTSIRYYRDFVVRSLNDDDDKNCTSIKKSIDVCLVISDTYDKDQRRFTFFNDYDLLPYYYQGVADFFSYVKYTCIKLGENFSSWWKRTFD